MSERIRTHPGANLKDCLEAEGWSVNELAGRPGNQSRDDFPAAERAAGHFGGRGAGIGAHRLEQRRILDAATGQLRPVGGPEPGRRRHKGVRRCLTSPATIGGKREDHRDTSAPSAAGNRLGL